MSFTIAVADKKSCLWLIATGSINCLEDFLRYGREILSIAKDHGSKRLLLDTRNMQEFLKPADIAEYADLMWRETLENIGLRVAVLVSEVGSNEEEVDLILQNRIALDYRRFTDYRDAESWLKGGCGMPMGER